MALYVQLRFYEARNIVDPMFRTNTAELCTINGNKPSSSAWSSDKKSLELTYNSYSYLTQGQTYTVQLGVCYDNSSTSSHNNYLYETPNTGDYVAANYSKRSYTFTLTPTKGNTYKMVLSVDMGELGLYTSSWGWLEGIYIRPMLGYGYKVNLSGSSSTALSRLKNLRYCPLTNTSIIGTWSNIDTYKYNVLSRRTGFKFQLPTNLKGFIQMGDVNDIATSSTTLLSWPGSSDGTVEWGCAIYYFCAWGAKITSDVSSVSSTTLLTGNNIAYFKNSANNYSCGAAINRKNASGTFMWVEAYNGSSFTPTSDSSYFSVVICNKATITSSHNLITSGNYHIPYTDNDTGITTGKAYAFSVVCDGKDYSANNYGIFTMKLSSKSTIPSNLSSIVSSYSILCPCFKLTNSVTDIELSVKNSIATSKTISTSSAYIPANDSDFILYVTNNSKNVKSITIVDNESNTETKYFIAPGQKQDVLSGEISCTNSITIKENNEFAFVYSELLNNNSLNLSKFVSTSTDASKALILRYGGRTVNANVVGPYTGEHPNFYKYTYGALATDEYYMETTVNDKYYLIGTFLNSDFKDYLINLGYHAVCSENDIHFCDENSKFIIQCEQKYSSDYGQFISAFNEDSTEKYNLHSLRKFDADYIIKKCTKYTFKNNTSHDVEVWFWLNRDEDSTMHSFKVYANRSLDVYVPTYTNADEFRITNSTNEKTINMARTFNGHTENFQIDYKATLVHDSFTPYTTGASYNDTIYFTFTEIDNDSVTYIKTSDEWKPAISYVRVNGEWKQCASYVYKNGEWHMAKRNTT